MLLLCVMRSSFQGRFQHRPGSLQPTRYYATVNVASSAPVRTSSLPWMMARPYYTQQRPPHKRTPPRFLHSDRRWWAKSAALNPRVKKSEIPFGAGSHSWGFAPSAWTFPSGALACFLPPASRWPNSQSTNLPVSQSTNSITQQRREAKPPPLRMGELVDWYISVIRSPPASRCPHLPSRPARALGRGR
jgi:hypothetical protein